MPVVTSKGQITIPKEIRDALGLAPGSEIEFDLEPGRVILRKRVSPEVFRRWQGYLHGKLPAGSVNNLIEMLRGERLPPVFSLAGTRSRRRAC